MFRPVPQTFKSVLATFGVKINLLKNRNKTALSAKKRNLVLSSLA
jgi:hypothetical protein